MTWRVPFRMGGAVRMADRGTYVEILSSQARQSEPERKSTRHSRPRRSESPPGPALFGGAGRAGAGAEWWVWVPPESAPDPCWAWTPTARGWEPLVYLATDAWTVADYDGCPRGTPCPRLPRRLGPPLAVWRTDRGRQVVWPGTGLPPDGADALHAAVSYTRGWWGLRVLGRSGPRRPSRGWRGRAPVGYPHYLRLLLLVWQEALAAAAAARRDHDR